MYITSEEILSTNHAVCVRKSSILSISESSAQYHVLGTDKIKTLFHEASEKNRAGQVTVQTATIEPILNREVQAVTPGAQKVVIVSIHVRFYRHEKLCSFLCQYTLVFFMRGCIAV